LRVLVRKFSEAEKAEALKSLLSVAVKADFIFDLGANVGKITKDLVGTGKVVFAFEPDPLAFAQLQLIVAPNLKAFNTAVWVSGESKTLFRHKDWEKSHSHTSSSLISSKSNVDSRNTIEVNSTDISGIVSNLRGFGLMKMDVEGAEYKLLNYWSDNKILNRFESIFCEFHAKKIRFGRIKHMLLYLKLVVRGQNKIVRDWY